MWSDLRKIGSLNRNRKHVIVNRFSTCRLRVALLFIARQHAMHAQRDSVTVNPSVCPSGIVPKRMHVSSKSFHHAVTKFQGNSLAEALKHRVGTNLRYSTEIAV